MSNYYNVLMPREYTTKDGQVKTAFTKIGVAFPFKEKEGYSLSLEAIPLQTLSKDGKLECKLLLMPPIDVQENPNVAVKAKKDKEAIDADSIPF